jgi:hypothetical protein
VTAYREAPRPRLWLAVVGSRRFRDLGRVRQLVASVPRDVGIVSGGAWGVDHVAEEVARSRGLEVHIIRPNWDAYGKGAGPRRNEDIVQCCDRLVAFWDYGSKGTQSSIRLAKKHYRPTYIVTEESRPAIVRLAYADQWEPLMKWVREGCHHDQHPESDMWSSRLHSHDLPSAPDKKEPA